MFKKSTSFSYDIQFTLIIIISDSRKNMIITNSVRDRNAVPFDSQLPAECWHVWVFHQSHSLCCWLYLQVSFLLSLSKLFPLWPFWLSPLQSVWDCSVSPAAKHRWKRTKRETKQGVVEEFCRFCHHSSLHLNVMYKNIQTTSILGS